jgi:hypothetical protein
MGFWRGIVSLKLRYPNKKRPGAGKLWDLAGPGMFPDLEIKWPGNISLPNIVFQRHIVSELFIICSLDTIPA